MWRCCCQTTAYTIAARLLRATATCNLTTITLTQEVAYILIKFWCSSGSRESSTYFSTLTPTTDSGKILFSTPNTRKNLRLPQLWLPIPTLQRWPKWDIFQAKKNLPPSSTPSQNAACEPALAYSILDMYNIKIAYFCSYPLLRNCLTLAAFSTE